VTIMHCSYPTAVQTYSKHSERVAERGGWKGSRFDLCRDSNKQREREVSCFGQVLVYASYPNAEGKDLEDALHCEHARKAPVEVLKRFGVDIALLVKLSKHTQHVARLSNTLFYSYFSYLISGGPGSFT
jgi:hypothetical protein